MCCTDRLSHEPLWNEGSIPKIPQHESSTLRVELPQSGAFYNPVRCIKNEEKTQEKRKNCYSFQTFGPLSVLSTPDWEGGEARKRNSIRSWLVNYKRDRDPLSQAASVSRILSLAPTVSKTSPIGTFKTAERYLVNVFGSFETSWTPCPLRRLIPFATFPQRVPQQSGIL